MVQSRLSLDATKDAVPIGCILFEYWTTGQSQCVCWGNERETCRKGHHVHVCWAYYEVLQGRRIPSRFLGQAIQQSCSENVLDGHDTSSRHIGHQKNNNRKYIGLFEERCKELEWWLTEQPTYFTVDYFICLTKASFQAISSEVISGRRVQQQCRTSKINKGIDISVIWKLLLPMESRFQPSHHNSAIQAISFFFRFVMNLVFCNERKLRYEWK